MIERFDVVIVGAGISGIDAACHLRRACPDRSFVVLEGRDAIGGTWDLFRYPGVRSDSDMFTFGFGFEPWEGTKRLVDGPSIRTYIEATARKYGVDARIRFGHRVARATWSTAEAAWTIEAQRADGTRVTIAAKFLWSCTGYYRYEAGYTPAFAGTERFRGVIAHPQRWPEGLDYRGKQVVVIGSGATAVTLVPAMAGQAAHVTMLQRSPSYVFSLTGQDALARALRWALPTRVVYGLTRAKNILGAVALYQAARRWPEGMRKLLIGQVQRNLGPEHAVDPDFTPRYEPWDERLCFVPDGDLFASIRDGRASVVTDTIETFTETGLRLSSGRELPADVVVTATGLELLFLGGITLTVDGADVDPATRTAYKGIMLDGVPNFAFTAGYINASWTLRADLVSAWVCRLLHHMDGARAGKVTPRLREADPGEPFMPLRSGYVQRALAKFPRMATRGSWRAHQNYLRELLSIRMARLDDPSLDYEAVL